MVIYSNFPYKRLNRQKCSGALNSYKLIYYYMDSGILLGTKTLVELIRHYIRDTVRVFSVCHA